MVKYFVIILLLFLMIAPTIAQNYSEEEQALIKAIEDETFFFYQKDHSKWADSWIHSPMAHFSVVGPQSHFEMYGWENINKYAKNFFENSGNTSNMKPFKDDYRFKINSTMAFVSFKEDGNSSTRILEKEKGKWKLIEMSVVKTDEFKFKEIINRLKMFVGKWYADTTGAEVPAWWNSKLNDVKCEIKYEDYKLKLDGYYQFQSGEYVWTKRDEITFALDQAIRKIATFKSEYGDDWSLAFIGFSNFDEKGNLISKMYRPEDSKNLRSKETLKWITPNKLEFNVTVYSDDGEVLEVFTYILLRSI